MRTSPLGMRRRVRRAPLLVCSTLVLVVVLGAACSDGGDDDGTSPTTTSPATTEPADDGSEGGDGTTTTEAPDEEATPSEPAETTEPGAVPGDDADVLTAEQAQAQLDALLAAYRQGLVDTRAAGVADERTLQAFSGAFTTSYADAQVQGLQQAGVDKINPTPPEVAVSDVEVTSATATCAAGTVTVRGLDGLIDDGTVEVIPPFYFRLEPAAEGAAAPAWRIALLNFSNDGEPLEEASCE